MLALRGPQYVMATELDEIKSILASDVDEDEEADLSALDKIKTKAKEMSSRTVLLPILIMMLMLTLQVCHFFYFISNYRYISSNAIMSVLMYVLEKKLECWNSVVCNRCLYYGLDRYIFSFKDPYIISATVRIRQRLLLFLGYFQTSKCQNEQLCFVHFSQQWVHFRLHDLCHDYDQCWA